MLAGKLMPLRSRRWMNIGTTLVLMAVAGWPAAVAAQPTQGRYELGIGGFEAVEIPDPATPAGQLYRVRQLLADDQPGEARGLANDWIDAHGEQHPLSDEAYLLRADAKFAQNNYYIALFDYEYLVRSYPGSAYFVTALEREFEIASMFVQGTRRKLWGMRLVSAEGEGEELLIRIQERAPGSAIAERAGKALADYYYNNGEMRLAAEAYSLFVDLYPNSQWLAYAMQRQVDANLGRFRGPRFDATGLLEAERRLAAFAERMPAEAEQHGADELFVRIDESLARKSLVVAEWYDGQNEPVSAKYMYRRVVTDHPQSAAAQRALARLIAMDRQLGQQLQGMTPPEAAEALGDEASRARRQREITGPAEEAQPAVESVEPVEPEAPIDQLPAITTPE